MSKLLSIEKCCTILGYMYDFIMVLNFLEILIQICSRVHKYVKFLTLKDGSILFISLGSVLKICFRLIASVSPEPLKIKNAIKSSSEAILEQLKSFWLFYVKDMYFTYFHKCWPGSQVKFSFCRKISRQFRVKLRSRQTKHFHLK